MRPKATMRPLLLTLLLWLGCDAPQESGSRAAPIAPVPRADTAKTVAPVADPDDCVSLPRASCMASERCTLEHAGLADKHAYACRPELAPCETGFAQAKFFGSGDEIPAAERQQQACNDRPGCVFDPGGCYCECRGNGHTVVRDGPEAKVCQCDCSGGPPPSCRAK